MADNLPLLPDKGPLCVDVRSVLQEVFRESDYLPPLEGLSPEPGLNDASLETDLWIKHLSLESEKLNNHEENLQKEYAKRLAKDPLPNIYKLHSMSVSKNQSKWKDDLGLLERKDLKPTLQQDANREESLWVKNILNGSSGNFSTLKITGSKMNAQTSMRISDEMTVQSMSWGEIASMLPAHPLLSSLKTPLPDYIICIPPQLQFINFQIGQHYTQSIRFLNLSKFEMRVSIRPPTYRELDVELCSRLVITSGSAAEIKIHFRPNDVRVLCDKLIVRVSSGQILCIPIECYMEPPMLDIIVPSITPGLSSPHPIIVQDVLDLGARLLGDVHRSQLVLRCREYHASFFLLSEDSWLEYFVEIAINLADKIPIFGVVSDCFYITPVRWSGGGITRGTALCRANSPGLHTTVLRILCSTAIVRTLHLVADALLFCAKHITLQAQDKDYDICSEDDPACEYYIHLGTSFPKCSLSATVTIANHSPVSYNYYWSVRPWGVCSCWQQSNGSQESDGHDSDLCIGALQAKLKTKLQGNNKLAGDEESLAVRVEQVRGCLFPRNDVAMSVRVPDVGETLGLRRAVLMLILTDIPKESFPSDYDPMIINVNTVEEKAIPGVTPRWSREVCEIVCAEMEVWWEVVPIRFALDPPLLLVPYSRRVKSVTVPLRATQLYGVTSVKAFWVMETLAPAPSQLHPGQSCYTTAELPLKQLPNKMPETSSIRLISEKAEWSVSSNLQCWSSKRALALRRASVWLGVLPPGSPVATKLFIYNDTHQNVNWTGICHRWYRERPVAKACVGRTPCAICLSRACTCSSLTPYRGSLNCKEQITLQYQANAPDTDGCVATLVQVRRTAMDANRIRPKCGSKSRASLVAYRVLAPRVTIAVLMCGGGCETKECKGCSVVTTSTLRPLATLLVGDTKCYHLRVTNLTPIPTRVKWEQAIEEEDDLKVMFVPEDFELGGYSDVIIMVVLEAKRVTGRRLFVRRASVVHAYKPLYLLIDLSISGVEVIAEFPIGGDETTDSFVTIKMIQKEMPWNTSTKKTLSPAELFAEDDHKKAMQKDTIKEKLHVLPKAKMFTNWPLLKSWKICKKEEDTNFSVSYVQPRLVFQEDEETKVSEYLLTCSNIYFGLLPLEVINICNCRYKMVYIPPIKQHLPPPDNSDDCPPVEIVEEPPPLTRVCPCAKKIKPVLPDDSEPYCLQFTNMPLRTVRSRTINLSNVSGLDARWRTAVRRYPREHVRTESRDIWSGDVREPGVVIACSPARGTVLAGCDVKVTVSVYADCWGLYYDQILIQMEDMEPLVLDVWIEVVGVALCFALQHQRSVPPVLWMSHSDPDRVIYVTNTSRADLTVVVYLLKDNEYPQEELPFRLYLRLFDVLPRVCPCLTAFSSKTVIEEESRGSSLCQEDMDTGVELFLAPDYGVQDEAFYQVDMSKFSINSQETTSLNVRLLARHEQAPGSSILLRCSPVNVYGDTWYRPPPLLQCVSLREAARQPCLRTSCSEIRVALCALDMPMGDIMRIRKRFNVRNVGEGFLKTTAKTELPWHLDVSRNVCDNHCKNVNTTYTDSIKLDLPPRSCVEMVVVLTLKTNDIWPMPGEFYLPRTITSTALFFYDHEDIMLLSIPLILDLDMPVLTTQPEFIDFGFMSDGYSRKSYFSVKHSSNTAVIELETSVSGDQNFRIWPSRFSLRPGVSERVYVQYIARWRRGVVAPGTVHVHSLGERRKWCGVTVPVRAFVSRRRPPPPADHTDDIHLLPLV